MAITVNITGGLVQLTGNPIWINCSGGSAPAGSSGYKILLKVISEDDKLDGAPFIIPIAPDADGNAVFDISGYVDQPVTPVFQYPSVGDVVAYQSQAFNVQLQAGERYWDSDGTLQEVWGAVESDIIQMLKGGTNPRQNSAMRDASINFYSLYVEGKRWLTTRPWGETVHPEQNIKLWFMVEASKSATLHLVTHYNDDSTNDYASESLSLNPDYLYEFNCNPALKGVDLEPTGKYAVFFDAYLDFGGGDLSFSRRFYFYRKHIERPLFFFFANSLGGIDDVFLFGHIKGNFTSESSIVERHQLSSDTVYDATLSESGKTGQDGWVASVGWKYVNDLPTFRDFLLGRRVWFLFANVNPMSFHVIPVIIKAGTYDLYNRQNDIDTFDIPFIEAHRSPYIYDNGIL